MKKLLILFMMLTAAGFVFGQEGTTEGLSEGLQAKNNGNTAFREKDYLSAIQHYEKYLKSGEEGVEDDLNTKNLYETSVKMVADKYMQEKDYTNAFNFYEKYLAFNNPETASDGQTLYSYAFASNKLNKNDIALSMFQKCIELNYKPDFSTIYIADIYRDLGDTQKMEEILKTGLEKYPDSKLRKNMLTMLIGPLLRAASEPFNEANQLAKQAADGGNADSYIQNMEKAVVKFAEAIPLFENILKLDPANQNATTYLDACKENIKKFDEYKASIKK